MSGWCGGQSALCAQTAAHCSARLNTVAEYYSSSSLAMQDSSSKVLVAGATGGVGQLATAKLLEVRLDMRRRIARLVTCFSSYSLHTALSMHHSPYICHLGSVSSQKTSPQAPQALAHIRWLQGGMLVDAHVQMGCMQMGCVVLMQAVSCCAAAAAVLLCREATRSAL